MLQIQQRNFLSKVILVNGNYAQTVLYFFLLMFYKVSPRKICWRGVIVVFFTFCNHLRANCKPYHEP